MQSLNSDTCGKLQKLPGQELSSDSINDITTTETSLTLFLKYHNRLCIIYMQTNPQLDHLH